MLTPQTSFTSRGSGVFSRRIFSVVLLVLLVALAGSGLGVWSLQRVSAETEQMVGGAMVTERLSADLRRLLEINRARARALALSSEPQMAEAVMPEIEQTVTQVGALLQTLSGLMKTPAHQASLTELAQANVTFVDALNALIKARDGGLTSAIDNVYNTQFEPASQALLSAVNHLSNVQREAISLAAGEISDLSESARYRLYVFGVLALCLGGVLSVWLIRGITHPIQQAVETANRVAALDLTMPIEGHERDEGGQLLCALARMQDALRDLVLQVQEASQNVAQGSTQIAAGNLDLSNRTEMAASFLQQTAAAVEEIATAMQQSLALAGQGEALVQSARVQADHGHAAMTEVMQAISTSSRQIEDITGVIDGLAFQTNILALNAAVEAARAGEAGRGFAVVAQEVRTLANRSAAAAHDIKALIASSASQVEQGTRKVNHARDSMISMVGSVRQVASSIGDIRANTGEQSVGMARISAAVSQLDQMTQHNAAAVEESASAAQSLQAQARDLRDAATLFLLPARDFPHLLQTPRQKLRQSLALGV